MPAVNASRVYLDYAATAPFDTRLYEALQNASWANANALYTEGREAATQLRDARARIARCARSACALRGHLHFGWFRG